MLHFLHNQLNTIQTTMPSRSHNPLFIPWATRSGRNVRQRAIFCSGAPADRASDPPTVQSVARSVQPSTAVQTLTRSGKDRRGSKEAEVEELEEESSKEEVEKEAAPSDYEDLAEESPSEEELEEDMNEVTGVWEGQSK